MKLLKSISLLAITLTILSCKKNSDSPSTNWEQDLKATAWSGDFQFSGGSNQTIQPLSLLLNADNTVTWFSITGSFPGVWSVKDNKITITFTDGKILTATVSKDNWSDFTNVTVNGWQVISLVKTVVPLPDALMNSMWKVKFTNGADAMITFMAANKLKYTTGGIPAETSYTIHGAGIKFSNFAFAVNTSDAYFILQNNSMKGFTVVSDMASTYYSSCTGIKQ
jgi:hypothetical protein